MRSTALERIPKNADSSGLNSKEVELTAPIIKINSTNTRLENLLNKSSELFWNFMTKHFSTPLKKLNVKVDKRADFAIGIIAIYFAANEIQQDKLSLFKALLFPYPFDIAGNIIHLHHLNNTLNSARSQLMNVVTHWDYLKPDELEIEYIDKAKKLQNALKDLIDHIISISSKDRSWDSKEYAAKVSIKVPEHDKFKFWKSDNVKYRTTPLKSGGASNDLIEDINTQVITDKDLAIEQLYAAFCQDKQDELDALLIKCKRIYQIAREQIIPISVSLITTELALLNAKLHEEEQDEKIKKLEADRHANQCLSSGKSDLSMDNVRRKQTHSLELQKQQLATNETPRRMILK